jgi:hypothetical protein
LPTNIRAFTDAAASAVAREIATLRQAAQAEREMLDQALAALEEMLAEAERRLAGKLPVVQEWQDGVSYAGDVRTFQGATWQALRDTGKEPGHDDWILVAERGADGVHGLSFRLAGTWADGNDYRALDVVTRSGASFAAMQDNPGPCPGDGWQMIARGKTGNAGERGLQGLRGEPGPPVVAMSVSGEGTLKLTNGDGTIVTCDLYPVLTKVAR